MGVKSSGERATAEGITNPISSSKVSSQIFPNSSSRPGLFVVMCQVHLSLYLLEAQESEGGVFSPAHTHLSEPSRGA